MTIAHGFGFPRDLDLDSPAETFARRQAKRGLAPAIHRRCPVSFTTRAPWRRMILDPLLGAHVLCFELSDECSETR
jgi:hypothetical protein